MTLAKYHRMYAAFISVSAKFVYGNDITVVSNPTGEYKDFVKAVADFFEVISRTTTEPPLYKLYNNQLARLFKEATTVSYINAGSNRCND